MDLELPSVAVTSGAELGSQIGTFREQVGTSLILQRGQGAISPRHKSVGLPPTANVTRGLENLPAKFGQKAPKI